MKARALPRSTVASDSGGTWFVTRWYTSPTRLLHSA